MGSRNFSLIFISSLLFLGCEKVSDEALNSGFKSDKEYQLHLNKLTKERDQTFKESILYATNLDILDQDSEYELAIVLLKKEQRKYISQGGGKMKLIVASDAIINLKAEFDSVKESQQDSMDEVIKCLNDIDIDLGDYSGSSYDLMKGVYEIDRLLCQIKMYDSDTLSEEFSAIHEAARSLANSEEQFLTKDDAAVFLNEAYEKR